MKCPYCQSEDIDTSPEGDIGACQNCGMASTYEALNSGEPAPGGVAPFNQSDLYVAPRPDTGEDGSGRLSRNELAGAETRAELDELATRAGLDPGDYQTKAELEAALEARIVPEPPVLQTVPDEPGDVPVPPEMEAYE